jgi:hypothetical protein
VAPISCRHASSTLKHNECDSLRKQTPACLQVLVKTTQKHPRRWEAMGPILACGDTNAAVDNLVEGLLDKRLRVVRLGQPAKVGEA